MIKFLFLIPLTLCVLWALYLRRQGYSMKQGRKGFISILIFSASIAAFYSLLIWLTH